MNKLLYRCVQRRCNPNYLVILEVFFHYLKAVEVFYDTNIMLMWCRKGCEVYEECLLMTFRCWSKGWFLWCKWWRRYCLEWINLSSHANGYDISGGNYHHKVRYYFLVYGIGIYSILVILDALVVGYQRPLMVSYEDVLGMIKTSFV